MGYLNYHAERIQRLLAKTDKADEEADAWPEFGGASAENAPLRIRRSLVETNYYLMHIHFVLVRVMWLLIVIAVILVFK